MIEHLIERILTRSGADERRLRGAYGLAASAVGVLVNALLFALKLVAGIISGSVAIAADAVNNLSDASSSIISLIGFKLASKPADEEHPYGHGRYEYLSALLVAVMILAIGLNLLLSSARRIISPEEVRVGALSVAILVFSVAAKLYLAAFNRRMGQKIGSQALIASAADSRNDVLTTAAVLAGMLVSRATGLMLDGFLGVGVALFILVSGAGLLRDTLRPVLGGMPSREELHSIREKVLGYPGVLGVHDLMVHDYGPGRQFATMHVEMSAHEEAMSAHEVIDRIERDLLRERGLHTVVHYDPVATDDARLPVVRAFVMREAEKIDPRLTIHDLRIVPCEEGERVLFDCVAPYGLRLEEEELTRRLSEAMRGEFPRYTCSLTLERGEDGE